MEFKIQNTEFKKLNFEFWTLNSKCSPRAPARLPLWTKSNSPRTRSVRLPFMRSMLPSNAQHETPLERSETPLEGVARNSPLTTFG